MADGARSSHPKVQEQLDRLMALGMGGDVLGLERVSALCAKLGNPQDKMPPVFHVAGTNGKGSTIAFLRAALEATGKSVHVFTSPHLVRFNERIRLAGKLIEDEALADLLEEVLDAAGDIKPTFFEATTAAAFLAFARTPADATLVEVGLGGRLDATNIIEEPLVTGIASLGLDHQQFLGGTMPKIGAEKAG
ncbi:MAG: bifunctional folylpolyglutamate synthase/dihydrofolate synthase, partial [Sphingomonadaceae bacterium]